MDAFDAKKKVFLYVYTCLMRLFNVRQTAKVKKKSYFNYFKPFIHYEYIF